MRKIVYRLRCIKNHGDTLIHYGIVSHLPQGTLIPKQAACGQTCPEFSGEVSRRAIELNTKNVCPKCREEILRILSNPQGETVTIAGHRFHLEEIQKGIHSEETADYIASLYCDNQRLGTVENDGHGGMTFFHASTFADRDWVENIRKEIEKEILLTCQDGTIIYYHLGDIADQILDKNGLY